MDIKWYYIISFWEGYLSPYGDVYFIIAVPKDRDKFDDFVYNKNFSVQEFFIIPQDPNFYMTARHRMRESSNPNQYFMIKGQEVTYPFILDEFKEEWKYDENHKMELLHHINKFLI